MTEPEVVAREVVVHGLVQGVFFRASCREQAQRVGARGWASNESDGTVRAHFEGSAAAVESMVEWCRKGPRGAVVERVDVRASEPTGAHGFAVG